MCIKYLLWLLLLLSHFRVLEWVAISFSNAWKWKEKVKSLSRVRLLATPWTAAHQAPPSMGFSRREYRSGVLLPSPVCCGDYNNYFFAFTLVTGTAGLFWTSWWAGSCGFYSGASLCYVWCPCPGSTWLRKKWILGARILVTNLTTDICILHFITESFHIYCLVWVSQPPWGTWVSLGESHVCSTHPLS